MNAAEFRIAREYMGLTTAWIAAQLGVNERTVRSWEQGRARVPEGVAEQMRQWEWATAGAVDEYVADLVEDDRERRVLVVARTDEEAPGGWPARWHRHVAARVAIEVSGLAVGYRGEVERT